MMQDDANGLGRESITIAPVSVRLMHAYHDCPEGQNTAACGHRFQSDPVDELTTVTIEPCKVCAEFVRLPCARCTA